MRFVDLDVVLQVVEDEPTSYRSDFGDVEIRAVMPFRNAVHEKLQQIPDPVPAFLAENEGLRALLSELRLALAGTYALSPEGREYLDRINAVLQPNMAVTGGVSPSGFTAGLGAVRNGEGMRTCGRQYSVERELFYANLELVALREKLEEMAMIIAKGSN